MKPRPGLHRSAASIAATATVAARAGVDAVAAAAASLPEPSRWTLKFLLTLVVALASTHRLYFYAWQATHAALRWASPPPPLSPPAWASWPAASAPLHALLAGTEDDGGDDSVPKVRVDRTRPAGSGCTFPRCNASPPPWGASVGGAYAWAPLALARYLPSWLYTPPSVPYIYLTVAHRNRVGNLQRLLGSLTASLVNEPWLADCVCVTVVDHNTTEAASLPTPKQRVAVGVASGAGLGDAAAAEAAALGTDTGAQWTTYALQAWAGESWLLDGRAFAPLAWAKAALLQGVLERIPTPPSQSIFFVCDADLVFLPPPPPSTSLFPFTSGGSLMAQLVAKTIRGISAFVPVLWSTCYGKGLDTVPTTPWALNSGDGFWRRFGTGMVAAFVSDAHAAGGYNRTDLAREAWGQEDVHFTDALARLVQPLRPRTPSLVHLYHSRVDWAAATSGTQDGIHMADGREVCVKQGTCTCPPGTTFSEIVEAQKAAAAAGRGLGGGGGSSSKEWKDGMRRKRRRAARRAARRRRAAAGGGGGAAPAAAEEEGHAWVLLPIASPSPSAFPQAASGVAVGAPFVGRAHSPVHAVALAAMGWPLESLLLPGSRGPEGWPSLSLREVVMERLIEEGEVAPSPPALPPPPPPPPPLPVQPAVPAAVEEAVAAPVVPVAEGLDPAGAGEAPPPPPPPAPAVQLAPPQQPPADGGGSQPRAPPRDLFSGPASGGGGSGSGGVPVRLPPEVRDLLSRADAAFEAAIAPEQPPPQQQEPAEGGGEGVPAVRAGRLKRKRRPANDGGGGGGGEWAGEERAAVPGRLDVVAGGRH